MRTSKIILYEIIIITLISPVLGFYYSIKDLKWPQRRWALIILITIFGSILTFPEAADSYRVQQQAFNYAGMSFYEFINILKHIVTLNPLSGYPSDVYIHVLSYFSGSIVGLPKLIFVIASFVFGYFYVTALSKILRWNKHNRKSIIFSAVILIFIILRSIDSLQSVRAWTGMWILFNGVFSYLQTHKKRYFWLILAAPLVHFMYFVISLPAIFVIFFKKLSPKIFILIYFSSFFININPVDVINKFKKNNLAEKKISGYYQNGVDPYLSRIEAQKNTVWYARFGNRDALIYGGNAFALTLILGGFFNKKRMTKLEMGLFSVGLMMASLANLSNFVFTFYTRTMANAVLYILATVVLLAIRGELLRNNGSKLILTRIMLWISILIFVPKVVYTLANIIYYTSFYMLAAPFLGWLPDLNVSIREVLGWFL